MTDQPAAASDAKAADSTGFKFVVGKATDRFMRWQQIPAWVLGMAAIVGGGVLIANPGHLTDNQSKNAWAAVIVALFLAVALSYRSAFTLNDNGSSPGGGQGADKPGQQPAADAGGKQAADAGAKPATDPSGKDPQAPTGGTT